MYDIYIYIYILKSLQTCQQSHEAKHGIDGRLPLGDFHTHRLSKVGESPRQERDCVFAAALG